ncbi:putative nuclease HARBI1 [Aphis craccivora]|uniref:Putative nuclease HARBI1 n=1 Tax=Aphis craccivora TaxID=307492 RepID=A0A6G0YCF6_APHCR|nr:putative nuclease HARBI1 [Aphis craccivora]
MVAKLENGEYQIRTNEEIYQLFQKPNINTFIRSKRLECAGNLRRENGICKQVLMVESPEDPEDALGVDEWTL